MPKQNGRRSFPGVHGGKKKPELNEGIKHGPWHWWEASPAWFCDILASAQPWSWWTISLRASHNYGLLLRVLHPSKSLHQMFLPLLKWAPNTRKLRPSQTQLPTSSALPGTSMNDWFFFKPLLLLTDCAKCLLQAQQIRWIRYSVLPRKMKPISYVTPSTQNNVILRNSHGATKCSATDQLCDTPRIT